MSEWQPIETAPKDGTVILAYIPHDFGEISGPAVWPCMAWLKWDGEFSHWDTWAGDDTMGDVGCAAVMSKVRPTHWMPMPAPPTSSFLQEDQSQS